MPKLTRNAAKCLKCNTIVESKYTHDWVSCPCGAIFVDGGLDYCRMGGDLEDIESHCEYESESRD